MLDDVLADNAPDGSATSRSSTETLPLNFLELPVDILNIILSPLLTYKDPIAIFPDFKADVHPIPSAVNVLLIHPALLPIASHILYSNEFALDLTTSSTSLNRGVLRDMSSEEPRATLRKVRKLSVHLDKLRGFITEIVEPLLLDMAQRGDLRDLSVFISGRAMLQREPLANLPFQALLRCLSDPDIGHARLCVLRRAHTSSAWSEYRRRDVRQGLWLELDWEEMVRTIDPEGKETPVNGASVHSPHSARHV